MVDYKFLIQAPIHLYTQQYHNQRISYSHSLEQNEDGSIDLVVKLTPDGPLNGEVSFTPHFRNDSEQKFGEFDYDWQEALQILLPNQGWHSAIGGHISNESDYINHVTFRNENGLEDNSLKPSWSELEKIFKRDYEILIQNN